jgi:DUF971 family protein
VEIGRANEHDVRVLWKGGRETVFPARFLRLQCPCAVCVDELTGRRTLQESSISSGVHPVAIHPVGRYAIQIYWSDNHSTGIYTWEYLDDLTEKLPG